MQNLRGLPDALGDKAIAGHAVVTTSTIGAINLSAAANGIHDWLTATITILTPYVGFLILFCQLIYWILKLLQTSKAKRRRRAEQLFKDDADE